MKYLLAIALSISIYFVYAQNIEITRLELRLDIARINSQILSIVKSESPNKEYYFDCMIRIEENFGKRYNWSIPTDGLELTIQDSLITLSNSKIGNMKSWFPPRDSNDGGVGNSVSDQAGNYIIEIRSKENVKKAESYFNELIAICNKS